MAEANFPFRMEQKSWQGYECEHEPLTTIRPSLVRKRLNTVRLQERKQIPLFRGFLYLRIDALSSNVVNSLQCFLAKPILILRGMMALSGIYSCVAKVK